MNTKKDKLETIYLEFRGKIKDFILRRVKDEHTAEDIVQDVFLKIHTKIDTLQDERKLESWIYQITRNAVIDHFRNKKIQPTDDYEIPENSDDDDDSFREVASGLKPMLDSLPVHYREALILTEFEGLTQKDMAENLGLSISGAKSRVQRARALLKNELLQCCHFEFDRFGKIIDYYPVTCPCCPEEKQG